MRNPDRIDKFLKLIEKIWKEYPDLRFCQLICNTGINEKLMYYAEDDMLEEALKMTYPEVFNE